MPNQINGTNNADALNGLSGDNLIDGLGGADKINGGAARDTLDGNQGNDTVSGNSGEDVLVYAVSENGGATDVYDGGSGKDFLQIELTLAQWLNPVFQSDLSKYLTFLNLNTHWKTEEANNSIFHFDAFDLSVSKVEWVRLIVDGVELSPEDSPVTLVADELQANEDTAGAPLNLLFNDTVLDQVATFSKTAPAHGTVNVVTNFSVVNAPEAVATYTADAAHWNYLAVGEVGTDTFTYTVYDADGDQATQTVTVKVHGRNDALSVTSGSQTGAVVEDAPTTPAPGDALTATGLITFTDPDLTDAHTASVTTAPPGALGALSLTAITESATTAQGSLGWTYTLDNAAAQSLGANTVKTETFIATIGDSHGSSQTQAITVTINGTNDAPVITVGAGNVDAASVDEANAGLTAGGTLTVTDVDVGDVLTYSVESVAKSGTGTTSVPDLTLKSFMTFNAGTWSFDSGSEAFDSLAAGTSLVLNYLLKVADNHGGSDTQAVTVTINGTNDAPVITVGAGNVDAASVDETNAGLTAGGTLTVTDVDVGDMLTYSVESVAKSGTGTTSVPDLTLKSFMTFNAGTWSFDSGSEAFDSLAAGTSLVLNYLLKVADNHGGSDTQAVTVTINGTNDAPTAVALSNSTVAENAMGAVIGALSTTDPDTGDAHTYAVSDARFEVVGGQLKLKAGESLDFEAQPTVNLNVTSTDAGGLSKVQAFTVTVTNVNEAPTAVALSNSTVAENAMGVVIGALSTTDPDAGDTHTYAVSDARFEVVGGQLKLKAGESLDFEAQPAVNLNVTSTDAGGLNKIQAFTVTVTNVNEAAVLPTASNDTTDSNNQDNDTVTATAGSVGANDTLVGTSGPNTLSSGNGNDVIFGGAGNDLISGGGDNDIVYGQVGSDTVDGGNNLDAAYGGSGDDVIEGSNGNDVVYGGSGADTTNETGSGDDRIFGGSGGDSINAGAGADTVMGGYGADTIDGGSGNDRFEYVSVLDTNDRILNFAAGDLIDLSGIDANGAGAGNPAFVGLTANSDQLVAFGASWFVSGGNTILIADTDGDAATAEFMITLVGVGHSLSAGVNVLL